MGERKRPAKRGLTAGAAAAALTMFLPSAAAQAQPVSASAISIEAQDLDAALRALAHQTGAQIIFSPSLVNNVRAASVEGAQSPEQALRRMLRDTGLTYRSTGQNTFTILAQADRRPARAQNQSADESGGLSDIIVTAQRREENLQDVPIAVSAVTADLLQESALAATRDLPQIVPSVQLTRSGPSGLFFIRGVGTTNAAAGEEGANAMYVDGVYIGDLGQTINYFNSVDRVEILRGPQGTLFGRNATGGLIHVITRTPGDELEVHGVLGVANYNTTSGQFYIGGPLSENLSADFAFTTLDQNEGWGRNLITGAQNKLGNYDGLRGKIVWDALDALRFTVSADHFESQDNWGLGWRTADGMLGFGGTQSPGGHDTLSNMPARTNLEVQGGSLTGELDLGFATLTSITARRQNENHSAFDVDGGPANRINIHYVSESSTIQQEFRLAPANTDPLSWQVGAFLLHSEASTDQYQLGLDLAAVGDGFHILADLETDSYAVFGEVTYAITDSTDLTAGVRYTEDQRHFDGRRITVLAGGGAGATAFAPVSELDYEDVTYRIALRQQFGDNVSGYASFNHGFKAGTFNLQNPISNPVEPQFIDAYEIGLKSELFDRRLRLNMALYHYDIEDNQVRSATVGGGSSILLNAASVEVDGIDIEFELAATDDLTIFGGFTALDSRFEVFGGPNVTLQAPITYPSPTTCTANGTADPGTPTGPPTGGITTCFGDVAGNQTPLAPDLAVSLGASYSIPLGGGRELSFTGLYSYNSGYVFEADNVQAQDAFSLFNASLEYRFNANVGLELWGRNIFDEDYAVQKVSTTTVTQVLAAPQTYGVNLSIDF